MALDHAYVHPRPGWPGRLLGGLLNARGIAACRRAILSRLPFLVLDSEVVDVVYLSWMVDAARAAAFAPAGARLWTHEGRTPLTILSYRHGHFGPRLAGPLRRLLPSPLQSNWRLYLAQPLGDGPAVPTVAFVHNVLDSLVHVAGTRLFSDALPSHLPARFELAVDGCSARVDIDPGAGSAPRFSARLRRGVPAALPPPWRGLAGDWSEVVRRLASQDAAVVSVPGRRPRTALAGIALPVDTAALEPLELEAQSLCCPLLDALDADPAALCFLLPGVRFSALGERLLGPGPGQGGPAG